MSIFLYSHGGSGNHGCEAIVRGTKEIINDESVTLYSYSKCQDEKYGLNHIVELEDARKSYKRANLKRILASLKIRLFHDESYATKISIDHMLNRYGKNDIAISIGGDNYCYPGFEEYCVINDMIRKNGVKTVLWGCSIEKSLINDILKEDLCAYDLIVARESITYDCLKEIGANAVLYADPAFQLVSKKCVLPFDKRNGKVIGLNISPLIMSYETGGSMAYQNYAELIRYILENTDYQIALIPHVVWKNNDDHKVNEKLYADFGENKRITVVQDHGCEELKYIISQCDMFVGARTHATIAAYSSCVPTLVVGYSVKARGIAKDIFGTEENYVLPVQKLKEFTDLTEAFKWIESREGEIRSHLKEFMPGYIAEGMKARESVLNL